MATRTKTLTNTEVKQAKPKEKQYKLSDDLAFITEKICLTPHYKVAFLL